MYVLNVLIASTLFISCKSAYVSGLEKCSIKDEECVRRVNKNILKSVGESGIPELEIPSIDPINVKNISVPILETMIFTFSDGIVKGIKNCDFEKFKIDLEKKTGDLKLVCNLSIKGHFTLSGSSPVLQGLLGTESINSNGNAKVKIEKLSLDFTFPFIVQKRGDGKTYIAWPGKNIKYKHEAEKVTFAADKVFIGKEDISKFVVAYLNENWKFLMQSFGRIFIDKAMEYYFDFAKKYFDNVPTNDFIIEDLSDYATK